MRKPKQLTPKQYRKWHKRIAHLRKELPLPYPVSVRTVPLSDAGYCQHIHNRYGNVKGIVIRIANWQDYLARVDTLLHEWAHALECAAYGNQVVDTHSEAWGVMYAKCYQADEKLGEWIEANGLGEK